MPTAWNETSRQAPSRRVSTCSAVVLTHDVYPVSEWGNSLVMGLATTALTPARWLGRAVRVPGAERHALTQAVKAGFAAGVAWLVAALLLRMPQPFLAPYAAVFAVESTVYRSFLSSARQVGTVAVGVLLAWLANLLVPMAVALPVAVVAGLLIGRWRWFGSEGTWIAATAVFVLSVNAGDGVVLVDRLGETVLGVVVAAVVNAVVFPPVYRDRAAAATARLGAEMATLLREMATSLRDDALADRASDWVRYAEDMRSLVREVDETNALTAESRVLNLRRARPRYRAAHAHDGAERLISAWPHLHTIAQSLHHVAAGGDATAVPDPDTAAGLADLLDGIAEAVEVTADAGDRRSLVVRRDHERLDALERRVDGLALAVTLGIGGLAPPLRRVLRALDG